jgi:hypothetical protein
MARKKPSGLRPSETVQCECCEQYLRLHELVGVVFKGDFVSSVKVDDENDRRFDDGMESAYIGDCPHCQQAIFTRHIT